MWVTWLTQILLAKRATELFQSNLIYFSVTYIYALKQICSDCYTKTCNHIHGHIINEVLVEQFHPNMNLTEVHQIILTAYNVGCLVFALTGTNFLQSIH